VTTQDWPIDNEILKFLDPDEKIHARTRAVDAEVAVTDRRIVVTDNERIALDVKLNGIRRIQFDIERDRPATLVIVPDRPSDPPQVLAIPPEEYSTACEALTLIGQRLAEIGDRSAANRQR
jgi:hypothetical protein